MIKDILYPDTKALAQSLQPQFPDIDFFKEGSNSNPVKTNIVGRNDKTYIKAFTTSGRKHGLAELELIHLFNMFSQQQNSSFSGPEIIIENTADTLFFMMKNITPSKQEIDFTSLSQEQIITFYEAYRQEFDKFEAFSHGKTSTQKQVVLQESIRTIKRLENKISFLKNKLSSINKLATKKINKSIESQLTEWMQCGAEQVREHIYYNANNIFRALEYLHNTVKIYGFEYNFDRLRGGHVFTDGEKHQLVDFDNVSYQIQGSELISLMGSNHLLPVYKYDSYEQREAEALKRREKILLKTSNSSLIDLLLFLKILGTIFKDFGDIQVKAHEKSKIEQQGYDPDATIKKGIEWNYRLLSNLYNL